MLFVNAGDLTSLWTNGRWRSAPHRVTNSALARSRYSLVGTPSPNPPPAREAAVRARGARARGGGDDEPHLAPPPWCDGGGAAVRQRGTLAQGSSALLGSRSTLSVTTVRPLPHHSWRAPLPPRR